MRKICYKCGKEIFKDCHEGLHAKCFCEWFGLAYPEKFKSILSVGTHGKFPDREPIFFQGVFPKYSATLSSKKYIIKIGEDYSKELPSTEYLCNKLASFLGIQVPKHFLIRFGNEKDAFVCYNFMQDYPRSDLIHIFRFLESPLDFNCDGILKVLSQLQIKNASDRFVKLCLFDALIGNHDRHGRNLAIIQTPQGHELSPFYDNPSYLATEDFLEADLNPTGAIATRSSQEPSIRDYVEEFYRLGHFKSVETFSCQLNNKLHEFRNLISNSFISQRRKNAFLKLVNKRFEEFDNSVSNPSPEKNKR